jgi:hypothetical protein
LDCGLILKNATEKSCLIRESFPNIAQSAACAGAYGGVGCPNRFSWSRFHRAIQGACRGGLRCLPCPSAAHLRFDVRFSWGAIDLSHYVLQSHDHQNRRVAISMCSTHYHDVCALRLSAQATPSPPRHRHLSDSSPVDNPGKHAPVSCSLMPYDASDSPLIISCYYMRSGGSPHTSPRRYLVTCNGVLTAAPRSLAFIHV